MRFPSFYEMTAWVPRLLPFPPSRGSGNYPQIRDNRAVVSTIAGQQSPVEPHDQGGEPLPGAFRPTPIGSYTAYNMIGIVTEATPGTKPVPMRIVGTDRAFPWRDFQPSYQADHMNPTLSVALNRHMLTKGPQAWHVAPVPAAVPGQGDRQTRRTKIGELLPQPIFPNRVTDWPKAIPRYLSFGQSRG